MKYSIIVLCIVFSSCCHNEMYRQIYINNQSGKDIYYGISFEYPDTGLIVTTNRPGKNGNISQKIKKGDQGSTPAGILGVNSTGQIFIFDADTIEKLPWDSIVKHKRYIRRYQFTKNDLEKSNWTITYP